MSTLRHGHCRKSWQSPEYRSWTSMLKRCRNAKCAEYPNYGGRGIGVCERWLTFDNFLADMGPRPSGTTLDRVNGDGDYELSNCRWATMEEQNSNTRRNNYLEAFGERLTMTQWANRLGVTFAAIKGRLRRGWPIERALGMGRIPGCGGRPSRGASA